MRILLINSFHTASHQRWAEALLRYSRHEIELYSLPGRHWKWRMHGAAVELSLKLNPASSYDLVLVTDMLDLATLKGLRPDLAALPCVCYFHENQLCYPWSPQDEDVVLARDHRYSWINYTSALAADALWFNSNYHKASWNKALPDFLRQFPEGSKLPLPQAAQAVLALPLEGIETLAKAARVRNPGPPIILWNHRWEYDKGPDEFFAILGQLKTEGYAFRLLVVGESYGRQPPVFAKAKADFASEIVHWGYVADATAYRHWLLQADIALVTSRHDFFGISVVEAIAAGAIPVLPEGLSYQEHLAPKAWQAARYIDRDACLKKMRVLLSEVGDVSVSVDPASHERRSSLKRYSAAKVVAAYDKAFAKVYSSRLSS